MVCKSTQVGVTLVMIVAIAKETSSAAVVQRARRMAQVVWPQWVNRRFHTLHHLARRCPKHNHVNQTRISGDGQFAQCFNGAALDVRERSANLGVPLSEAGSPLTGVSLMRIPRADARPVHEYKLMRLQLRQLAE